VSSSHSGLRSFFEDRKLDAEQWCEGRNPYGRAMLLGYLTYGGVRHLADSHYATWFAGITLIFHEMGHLLFAAFGDTLAILGGSIMQLLIPTFAAVYLLVRQRDFFGFAVGSAWLSFAMWELALYIWDAPRESLPLAGFSDHPQHDWATLLTQWRLLNSSDTIALCVRGAALVTWALSIALGAWLCWRMFATAQQAERPSD